MAPSPPPPGSYAYDVQYTYHNFALPGGYCDPDTTDIKMLLTLSHSVLD